MYLQNAVGIEQQWPDCLFTDQYLFHENLRKNKKKFFLTKKQKTKINYFYLINF